MFQTGKGSDKSEHITNSDGVMYAQVPVPRGLIDRLVG